MYIFSSWEFIKKKAYVEYLSYSVCRTQQKLTMYIFLNPWYRVKNLSKIEAQKVLVPGKWKNKWQYIPYQQFVAERTQPEHPWPWYGHF